MPIPGTRGRPTGPSQSFWQATLWGHRILCHEQDQHLYLDHRSLDVTEAALARRKLPGLNPCREAPAFVVPILNQKGRSAGRNALCMRPYTDRKSPSRPLYRTRKASTAPAARSRVPRGTGGARSALAAGLATGVGRCSALLALLPVPTFPFPSRKKNSLLEEETLWARPRRQKPSDSRLNSVPSYRRGSPPPRRCLMRWWPSTGRCSTHTPASSISPRRMHSRP